VSISGNYFWLGYKREEVPRNGIICTICTYISIESKDGKMGKRKGEKVNFPLSLSRK
jgi:hypothetical protein